MIYGNINNSSAFYYLNSNLQKCLTFIKENDMVALENGTIKIENDDLFVNVVEYDTVNAEERFWEAHKNYLDLHYMINGSEKINVNFTNNMEILDFVEKDDFVSMKGNVKTEILLEDGDFLICYPTDAHMTAVKVGDTSQKIKKAIFKVKI